MVFAHERWRNPGAWGGVKVGGQLTLPYCRACVRTCDRGARASAGGGMQRIEYQPLPVASAVAPA